MFINIFLNIKYFLLSTKGWEAEGWPEPWPGGAQCSARWHWKCCPGSDRPQQEAWGWDPEDEERDGGPSHAEWATDCTTQEKEQWCCQWAQRPAWPGFKEQI